MFDTSVLLDRASLLLDQRRYKDAEAALKQALEQEPENHYALSLLARCCYSNSRHLEGIEIISQAIALQPQNSYYFYLLGFGYYQKNQNGAAIDSLKTAIQLHPYFAEYYGLLSFILIDEKQFEKGLEKADEGLAVDPENLTCLNARSRALNKLRRTNDAIETMQDALAQDPDNEMTHATVGWNFLEKGRHKEAQKHFLEALRINPNQENSRRGLKESLKSKVLPYKWLLQYSFWVNDKGRKMRTALPIALFIIFRLLIVAFDSNEKTALIAWTLAGIYLLLVITSWTINSIANFFLLFHPTGKYALTQSERWSAVTVVSALITGLLVIGIAVFATMPARSAYDENLLLAGLVCLTMALPLSEVDYPLVIKGKSWRKQFSLALIALGLLTLLVYAATPLHFIWFAIYGVCFIIYNWAGIAR